MSWKPPINRENKELFNQKRFFRLLSEKSNFIDPDASFLCYMGLVALVEQELRLRKFVRLPHLGDFALVEQKPRMAWVGKSHVKIGARDVVKFYPKEKMRRHFSLMQDPPTFL
jgi:nucleoid DNA-binding protein